MRNKTIYIIRGCMLHESDFKFTKLDEEDDNKN